MIFWMIVLLLAAPAALLTAHYGILRFASGEEVERARHTKRALVWAGVLAILVMVLNGFYGSLLMLSMVGWIVYQCVKLSDALAERLRLH